MYNHNSNSKQMNIIKPLHNKINPVTLPTANPSLIKLTT